MKYGDTLKLQTPYGTIVDAQVVSTVLCPWVYVRVYQTEFPLKDLLAQGWQVLSTQRHEYHEIGS